MFDWLRKRLTFAGSVYFRGTLPPQAVDFDFLKKEGISVRVHTARPEWHWGVALTHADWGTAVLSCPREQIRVPRVAVEYACGLTTEEKKTILLGESHVDLTQKGLGKNILRDRKNALRFLRAVQGTDGLAAMDFGAHRFWSRDALDDELCHDADLDIEQTFTLHAVTSDSSGTSQWLHSHGLSEIGFFDFDIVNPSQDLGGDAYRAIAFAIAEGHVAVSTPSFRLADPGGRVRFVEASDFNRYADPRYAGLRDDHGGADGKRSVLCEPAGRLFGRWSRRVKPSRFLSNPLNPNTVFHFSREASELMAERARGTYSLLRRLKEELDEFEFPVAVKLGYRTDGGGENDKEHLWFTAHTFYDDEIDGTLENQPLGVARLKKGDRGRHPVDLLSDWVIFTPAGNINPRHMGALREIRQHGDELRKIMAQNEPR
jgi:uncharacterized protein YegJ (DUF2314 family)